MAEVDPINMRSFLRLMAGIAVGSVAGVAAGFAINLALLGYRWQPPNLAEQAAQEDGAVRTVVDGRGTQILQRCRGACDEVR